MSGVDTKIKVVFICGSLEPGRDGVGDYTRRLAGQLRRQGNETAMIALHDKHLSKIATENQHAESEHIGVLRLPANLHWKNRIEIARKWIDEFNPDWLSLQYVPFGFQSKGLPFGLSKRLQGLGGKRNWHIMFHELWVGMDTHASIKLKLWGTAQRILIKSLIQSIRTRCMHTQSRNYQAQLQKLGYHIEYLPLFTNIPRPETISECTLSSINLPNKVTLVIFGTIYPRAPLEEILKEAVGFERENKISIALNIIGKVQLEQQRWAKAFQTRGMVVNLLGEQSPENVSKILLDSSIGISTTPYAIIEKSSAAATMLGHNLPVLCVAPTLRLPGIEAIPAPSGIFELTPDCLKKCVSSKRDFATRYEVFGIADQFVKNLLASS